MVVDYQQALKSPMVFGHSVSLDMGEVTGSSPVETTKFLSDLRENYALTPRFLKPSEVVVADINELEIVVLKYDSSFTKRSKDIKKNTWFSFPNDLLLHPDFTEINGEELKWFIWIVSICSKLNQNKIRLNISHAEKVLSLDKKYLFSMIKKLQQKQIDVVCDQTATSPRPDGDQSATDHDRYSTSATLHYITLHNTTERNIINNISSSSLKNNDNELEKKSKRQTFKISSSKQLAEIIPLENKQTFFELYPDQEFFQKEFLKINNWINTNPKKCTRSVRGWVQFLGNWFEKAWNSHQKNIIGNKVSGLKITEEQALEWLV